MFRLSLDLVLAYRLIQKSPGSECRYSLFVLFTFSPWWGICGRCRGVTFFSSLISTLLIERNLMVDTVDKIPGKAVCI